MIFLDDIRPVRFVPLILTLLFLSFGVAGCRVTVLSPSSDDTARDRNAVLEEENQVLTRENEGLKVRISEAESEWDPMAVQLSEATPRLISMTIQDSSLVEPLDEKTGSSQLILRMSPSDDRGRFLQVVGGLSVTVVGVSVQEDPILLAQQAFTPTEVRDAWRGGLMGSGYVFEIPLTGSRHEELPDSLDVVTLFESGAGDQLGLRDERPVRVRRSTP